MQSWKVLGRSDHSVQCGSPRLCDRVESRAECVFSIAVHVAVPAEHDNSPSDPIESFANSAESISLVALSPEDVLGTCYESRIAQKGVCGGCLSTLLVLNAAILPRPILHGLQLLRELHVLANR